MEKKKRRRNRRKNVGKEKKEISNKSVIKRRNRKGFYYSLDAFLAALLILAFISLQSNPVYRTANYEKINFLEGLSHIRAGDAYNYSKEIRDMIDQGILSGNESVLEAIGELWALGYDDEAANITRKYLESLNMTDLGIYINGYYIAGKNTSFKNGEIDVEHKLISGVARYKPLEGISSTASLRKILNKEFYSYAYIGGFIGQGNITLWIDLPLWINNSFITSFTAYMDNAGSFDVYVNGFFCKKIIPTTPDMVPDVYDFSNCINLLSNGTNVILLETNGEINESYIAGGYVKIGYKSPNLLDKKPLREEIYRLPGIKGIINLYDGIPVKGTLKNLSMHIHLNNSKQTIMVIGYNKYLLSNGSNESIVIEMDDTNFSGLNYSEMSNTTVPLRIYSKEVIPAIISGGNADVVLITDVSGSMDWRLDSDATGIDRDCNDTLLYDSSTKRISLAKCLDIDFVETVLNYTGNRIALVAFDTSLDTYSLTDDKDALEYEISQYSPGGGTCICCALNSAYNILNSQSNSSRKKFIVLMSDGIPTHKCSFWGCTGTSTTAYYPWFSGCNGDSSDCNNDDCSCPMTNANFSSCRVHQDLNTTVYSIGFGPVKNCYSANKTLRAIAECGNGSYYASDNATGLEEIYNDIANDIVNISYKEQVVLVEGDFVPAELYPDSYINITTDYSVDIPKSSIDIFYEENIDDCNKTVEIPEGIVPLEATLTSFSGKHWTKEVIVNNNTILNLSKYRFNYVELGDPFLIPIPISIIDINNNITMLAGDSEINTSPCMCNNSLILHVAVPITTQRSGVLPSMEPCNWSIEIYDKTIETMYLPNESTSRKCYYTNSTISYNTTNAYDSAVYSLLRLLDPDHDGRIIASFKDSDIQIILTFIGDVPYMWGPSLIEAVKTR